VRALGDLAERRRFIAMLGEQLAHRGSNALPLFKLVLFPKTEFRRLMRLQEMFSCRINWIAILVCLLDGRAHHPAAFHEARPKNAWQDES
jgi:hypothetical protein